MHGLRLDKWLWAARFFKTRSLASEAIDSGRVRAGSNGGARIKPAKEIHCSDMLQIQIGNLRWEVQVIALSDKRGSASVARLLYQETAASIALRTAAVEQQKLLKDPAQERKGRPTKRELRELERLTAARGD